MPARGTEVTVVHHAPDKEMTTVAFELAALERLEDPAAVFSQTRGWARSVGLVSDRPTYVVTNFARRRGMNFGFHSGPRSLVESLPVIKAQPEHEADRYLLIGTDAVDPAAVEAVGWAFLPVEEAAAATGWVLGDPVSPERAEDTHEGWP